jgi:DNA-binding IclR family transcriptional regulator
MRALSTARAGKPGSLTVAQLIEQCNLTKSAVHTHLKTLEKDKKVWKREENDPRSGRPCTMVYDARLIRVG